MRRGERLIWRGLAEGRTFALLPLGTLERGLILFGDGPLDGLDGAALDKFASDFAGVAGVRRSLEQDWFFLFLFWRFVGLQRFFLCEWEECECESVFAVRMV